MPIWKLAATIIAVAATVVLALQRPVVEQLQVAFGTLSLVSAAVIVTLFAGMRICQAAALKVSLSGSQSEVGFQNALGLAALKGFYNLGFGGAGLLAQALRGRARLNIQIKDLAAATLLQAAIIVTLLGLIFATLSVYFAPDAQKVGFVIFGLAFASVPFCAQAFLQRAATPNHRKLPVWLQRTFAIGTAGTRWSAQTKARATLILFLYVLSRVARILVIALVIDPEVNVGDFVLVVVGADLVSVIPITPGGIGVREMVIGAGGAIVGSFDLFLSAAVLDRITSLVLNFVHGLIVIVWHAFDVQP